MHSLRRADHHGRSRDVGPPGKSHAAAEDATTAHRSRRDARSGTAAESGGSSRVSVRRQRDLFRSRGGPGGGGPSAYPGIFGDGPRLGRSPAATAKPLILRHCNETIRFTIACQTTEFTDNSLRCTVLFPNRLYNREW